MTYNGNPRIATENSLLEIQLPSNILSNFHRFASIFHHPSYVNHSPDRQYFHIIHHRCYFFSSSGFRSEFWPMPSCCCFALSAFRFISISLPFSLWRIDCYSFVPCCHLLFLCFFFYRLSRL